MKLNLAPILTIFFFKYPLNRVLYPPTLKTAHVAHVYKKGLKYNPKHYRPISLTCICYKLLEHIVVSNIISHADKHNILYPLQHCVRVYNYDDGKQHHGLLECVR